MNRFSYILGKVEDGFIIFGGVIVFVLMMVTVIDVSGRYLLRAPLKGSVEVSEVMLMALVGVAIAGTQRTGGHVGVDALIDKLKRIEGPLYSGFLVIGCLLTLSIFFIAFYYCFWAFLQAVQINETTLGPLYFITWPAKGLFCFGLLLMCVRLCTQFIESVSSIRTKEN